MLAAPLFTACEGGREALSVGSRAEGPFTHGVASGDPLADSVLLWTRVETPAGGTVQWRVYADAQRATVVSEGTATPSAERDYVIKVVVEGLQAGTTYYYDFETAGAFSPLGRTKTLPLGHVESLRVALATCSNTGSVFNAYQRIAEREDLDAVVHLGDYLYADTAFTLQQYRDLHKSYKANHAELREVHRMHPMIVIWDDHESTNDAYADGAPPPNPAVGPLWPLRKNAATQAFFEYLPIRDNADRRIYRDFVFGDLMQLVMLDGRLEGRDPQVNGQDDPERQNDNRSMLGLEQEAWLADTLRQSTATWKLIGNQTMLGHLNEVASDGSSTNNWMDQWDGYPPARQRFYDVLKGSDGEAAIDNVVVCTGDWHNSFIMDLPEDPAVNYDRQSGAGSLAVEFVTPSITSGFFSVSDLEPHSPHIKHHNDSQHGYVILDMNRERLIGEEWYVDTVSEVSSKESLGVAFEISAGSNRLRKLPG